eukprot:Em0012g1095a
MAQGNPSDAGLVGNGRLTTGTSRTGEINSASLYQQRIQDLVAEVDPKQMLDDDVEELLMQLADDFIESTVTSSCQLAKHRSSSTLEVKDLQLHLDRAWNMVIPGFGNDERPHKKSSASEAHKQRINMIKKARR